MPILHFKGKSVIQNHHHTVKFHELDAVKAKGLSKEPSLDDNLIIHGDNLVALKALLPTYSGKVKCIYIDPPYNTGNEHWIYNDNVNSPMIQEWIGKEVARDDLSRHDKWCCMMYSRLCLLKELLKEDGAIFISIDDNEQANLHLILDEIFGEENHVGTLIWQRTFAAKNDAKFFSTEHEYLVTYAKDINRYTLRNLPRGQRQNDRYDNPDNDPRGPWTSTDLLRMEHRENSVYSIRAPSGKVFTPKPGTSWRHPEQEMKLLIENNEVFFGAEGNAKPRRKRFLKDVKQGMIPQTIWKHDDVGHTQEAKQLLKSILDESTDFFETPKPVRLIKRIMEVASGTSDIILDSFAGSGTTAHAVLEKNLEDGGNRRFILVECEDYADRLTAERVRRVSKGVKGAKDEALKKGLGGTFSYYELGKPIDMDKMLEGNDLPSFQNLAHYAFFTATGETFNPKKVNEKEFYIGSSSTYEVFLLYAPDAAKLRGMALNLEFAKQIDKKFPGKAKLVFAPACFLEEFDLRERNIRFAQLPFEIYRLAE